MDHKLVGGVINSLPIETMVAAPLMAAVKAQKEMSLQLADYINSVGIDQEGNVRVVTFNYKDKLIGENGEVTPVERSVQAPFLALTGIPNFAMETVEINFELEVKTAEMDKKSLDAKAEAEASGKFFGVRFKMNASVAHHSEQTRQTDTSAKYSFKVTAQRQAPPESLMRVLDIMTNSLANPAEGRDDTKLIDEPVAA